MLQQQQQIREELQQSLGCTIADEWWDACCHAVTSTTAAVAGQPPLHHYDTLLTQLLHSDLRDVVVVTSNSTTTTTTSSNNNVLQLSPQVATCPHQELHNVHILLQIDDWVDVSMGKEARILQETTNSISITPQSTQCLKLFLTDGRTTNPQHPTTTTTDTTITSTSTVPPMILAMEVTPMGGRLGSSSSSSQYQHAITAGCKLLLKGDVTRRWGILQLHAGNATLLGGSVTELVHKRRAALEQAQKDGMVGVDPTIRALIGTSANDPDNDLLAGPEQDEGEGESGDVVDGAVAGGDGTRNNNQGATANHPPMAPPRPPPIAPLRQSLTERPLIPVVPTTAATAPIPRQQQSPHPTQTPSLLPPVPPPLLNQHGRSTNGTAATTTSTVQVTSSSTSSTTNHPTNNNPYATTMTTPALLGGFRTAAQVTANANTYQQPPVSSSRTRNTAISTVTTPAPYPQRNHTAPIPYSVDSPSATMRVSSPHTTSHFSSTREPVPLDTITTTRSETLEPQPISFPDLYALLQRLVHNPSSDSDRQGRQLVLPPPPNTTRTWLVKMKQWGTSIHFNIGKEKIGKKTKVYHFEMHATFGDGSRGGSGVGSVGGEEKINEVVVVACHLPSQWIEPLFEKSPSELRALSRTDKASSQDIATRGGERVKQVFFEPVRTWKASLIPTIIDTMLPGTRLDDIATPILVLEPIE